MAPVQLLDFLPEAGRDAIWRAIRGDICFWAAVTLFSYDYLGTIVS